MNQIVAEPPYPLGSHLTAAASTPAAASLVAEFSWAVFALGLVAGIGALKLLTPFDGDQALFLYFAQAIDHGQKLYVDVWDMKQPGVFWFYWLGGKLFGSSELSVKLLELSWFLAFTLCLILCLRRLFVHPWMSSIAAAAALGSYYASAGTRELTQAEILLSFPMFLSAWLLARDYRSSGAAAAGWLAAGGFAAVAVVFKLFYAPIFIGFVLVTIFSASGPQKSARALLASGFAVLVPFTCGVAAVLGAVSLVLWWQGIFGELVWNSFVYPFHALSTAAIDVDSGRLLRNSLWLLAVMAPWLPFALITITRVVKANEPALMRLMLTWVLLTAILIILQRLMFWKYHFLLLFVPLSILAARGLDLLLSWLSAAATQPQAEAHRRLLSPAVLTILFALPAMSAIIFFTQRQAEELHLLASGGKPAGIERYRSAVGRDYGWIREQLSGLRTPGGEPIYVFGNPLIYLITERRQAIPINGWSWEAYPTEKWEALPEQLIAARPAYLFVDRLNEELISENSRPTRQFIDSSYVLVKEIDKGRLYARRSPAPDASPDTGWHPHM